LATPTEAEAPESTADVKSLVDLSELKKELQALEKCDTEENLVIVNINDLMDKLASISITMTK
jgi:hypothetical protein